MKFSAILLFAAAVLSAPTQPELKNQYIVKMKFDSESKLSMDSHYKWLEAELNKIKSSSKLDYEPKVNHKYETVFQGYALTAPETLIDSLKSNPDVEYVEEDGIMTTMEEFQKDAPSWGLPRVSQRDLPLEKDYKYPSKAGEGVSVYVLDTGVHLAHSDFGGRAVSGAWFVENDVQDGNGHGTHCSGTIAGTKYGVAKKATIVGVKVLSASGSGSYSGVIGGIDWVAKNAVPGKSVASMSLGGGKSQAVNDAIDAATAKNIPFAIAAGNNYGRDACTLSPAGAPTAFTVGASDINDKIASFSNVGPCVKIFAPGVNIASAWLNQGNNTISGTSMATPHTAGVIALALAERSFSSAKEVYDFISAAATPNKITGLPANTVNKLLYNGF